MQALPFLRTRGQRDTAGILAILLWAPAWMIPAIIIGQPWALVGGAIMTGLPLLLGALWLLHIVWRQADPVQRLLVVLFLVFVTAVAATMNWGPYPDQY